MSEELNPLLKSIKNTFDSCLATAIAKNNDYAGDEDPLNNLRRSLDLGIEPFLGVIIRLKDKESRRDRLAKGISPKVKNESLRDTMVDSIVYNAIGIFLLDEAEAKARVQSVR
jgi:hypothetical protein